MEYSGRTELRPVFQAHPYIDGQLTRETVAALRTAFARYGHSPSEHMWEGIEAAVRTIEQMANGSLPPLPHLSSLDPGVETESVIHSVRRMIASPYYTHVGDSDLRVPYQRNQGAGSKDGIGQERLCRLHHGQGGQRTRVRDIDSARVLFVTQQMIGSRLSGGKPFSSLTSFISRAIQGR